MMLTIYIRSEYHPLVSNIEMQSIPTGVAHLIGNKGGVGISFKIINTSYFFIGCHLAARPNNLDLRIENYHELVKKIRLGNENLETVS